ncbi:ATP-binding protein [Halanaerobaculum tunisiense]
MKLTVLSGKGGTGKTTVATNLALSLDNVQFFDADVEEPNSYIFINPDFAAKEQKVYRKVPVIDQDKCTSCRACVDFCEYNALAMLGDEVLIYPEVCHSCGGCQHLCPAGAIREEERVAGKVNWDQDANGLEFYQGELTIGEASAVPVIENLKENISDSKTVIIDAPPGTTCPTIEATIDSDYCILVTEPTPFGLHDLKMASELVEELGKPYGVIINRSEPKADQIIEEYCAENDIPILLKIPFKRQIAKLYSQGIPFVEELSGWKEKFQQVIGNCREI